MSAAALDLTVWTAIVGAVDDAATLVDRAFAADPEGLDLNALFRKVVFRLDALSESLRRTLPESRARQLLAPITFLLDERVLGRLAGRMLDRELSWPLLQREMLDLEYGGDLFFMHAERLGHGPESSPLLVQVFEYCLREGFLGRYADRPDVIEELRASLWARLEAPLPPGRGGVVALDRLAHATPRWLGMVALGMAALLACQGLLFAAYQLL